MANYYADTSVLAKRHVIETGSTWVQTLTDPAAGNTILTAYISLVEVYSALNRHVRKQLLNPVDYTKAVADVSGIFASQYGIVPLQPEVIDEARVMIERHSLRAYDAVQLASALRTRRLLQAASALPPIFLSADDRLLAAARAEGFVTDNPNAH